MFMRLCHSDLIIRKLTKSNFLSFICNFFPSFDFFLKFLNPPLFRRIIIPLAEVDDYCRKTLDPEFKGVVFQYITTALYINQMNHESFTYKICKESLMTNHLVIYFRKGFYLVDEINERIMNFQAGGITNYFIGKYADEKFKITDNQEGPSELTVAQMIGIFQLWSFGLAFCLIIFIAELFMMKVGEKKEGRRPFFCKMNYALFKKKFKEKNRIPHV